MDGLSIMRDLNRNIFGIDDTDDDILKQLAHMTLSPIPLSRYSGNDRSCTIFATALSMGYMSTPDTFVQEWRTDNSVRFHYN